MVKRCFATECSLEITTTGTQPALESADHRDKAPETAAAPVDGSVLGLRPALLHPSLRFWADGRLELRYVRFRPRFVHQPPPLSLPAFVPARRTIHPTPRVSSRSGQRRDLFASARAAYYPCEKGPKIKKEPAKTPAPAPTPVRLSRSAPAVLRCHATKSPPRFPSFTSVPCHSAHIALCSIPRCSFIRLPCGRKRLHPKPQALTINLLHSRPPKTGRRPKLHRVQPNNTVRQTIP